MEVTLQGVLEARGRIARFLPRTPLVRYPLLSRFLGCEAYVKHEAVLPTGAFKVRGGINLVASLSPEERMRGLATATRGNHGQSIALASRIFGVKCLIGIPEGNNPEKNDAMAAFGADLLVHGKDFDEAREKIEAVQREKGLRYVSSGNEPLLIHGVGTYALEIFEDLPDADVVLVPIGGGSGASGVITVARALGRRVTVIGVQAERAPAVSLSWKSRTPVRTDSADTIADGLATRVPFSLPLSILWDGIDDILTVSESELREAVFNFFRLTHHVAEPAAAAPLAAACRIGQRLAGKKVVLVQSGCNIDTGLLGQIIAEFSGAVSG